MFLRLLGFDPLFLCSENPQSLDFLLVAFNCATFHASAISVSAVSQKDICSPWTSRECRLFDQTMKPPESPLANTSWTVSVPNRTRADPHIPSLIIGGLFFSAACVANMPCRNGIYGRAMTAAANALRAIFLVVALLMLDGIAIVRL